MTNPNLIFGTIDDPVLAAATCAQIERGERNSVWLAGHWAELLPQARGKFVVVAGQTAYIADTAADAWAWAKKVHPEDNGAIVQYVRTEQGPRIYANCGLLGSLR